jgi:hypothetical protein
MGNGGIAPPFLTSTLGGGERSVSRPCRFTPGIEPPVPIGSEAGWDPEPVIHFKSFTRHVDFNLLKLIHYMFRPIRLLLDILKL